jgi:predicted transcriptional regulator
MPYDSSLDEELFTKEWENDTGKIVVSVHSYNKGVKKLQIVREIKDRIGNYTFAKLGRLSKEELQGILPLIQEAIEMM